METQVVPLNSIKRNLFTADIAEPVKEIAHYLANNFGAKSHMILQQGSYELIADELEYQAAVERGDTEVEVIIWNIPDNLLFAAKLLHCGSKLKYYDAFPVAEQAMQYFSFTKGGTGAEIRKQLDTEDTSLAEFVAALLKTNRTDLFRIMNIGKVNRNLLLHVDSGQVSLLEAERIAKTSLSKQKDGDDNDDTADAGSDTKVPEKSKYKDTEIIDKIEDLRPEELAALRIKLIQFLTNLQEGTPLPTGAYIERVYTHVAKNSDSKRRVDHLLVAFADGSTKIQIFINYEVPE